MMRIRMPRAIAGTSLVFLLIAGWWATGQCFGPSPLIATRFSPRGKRSAVVVQSSSLPTSASGTTNNEEIYYPVQVQFDDFGETETIHVRAGETLLQALDRQAAARGWSDVPSDCRRGNCLTCTAQHLPTSRRQHVQSVDGGDGLSPSITLNPTAKVRSGGSRSSGSEDQHGEEQEKDDSSSTYLLTCRSTVTGHGVALRLGQNTHIWQHVYQNRFVSDETRQATDAAVARVLRQAAELDPEAWKQQMEALWEEDRHGQMEENNSQTQADGNDDDDDVDVHDAS